MLNIKWVGANANNYQVGRGGKNIKYVVLHWIVGTLESADATFQKPDRIASATYGIGDNEIHQYVKEEDTSYANGNLLSNRESVTIEHEGGWLLPDKVTRFKPTSETHETSAQLVADICKRYKIPIDRKWIKKHSEVSDKPTECCGLLDIDWIVKRAAEINAVIAQPIPQAPDENKINMYDAARRAYKALTGEWVKQEEIDPWLAKGISLDDMMIEVMKGDGRFKELWLKPYITQIEADAQKVQKDFKAYVKTQNDYKVLYESLDAAFEEHLKTHPTIVVDTPSVARPDPYDPSLKPETPAKPPTFSGPLVEAINTILDWVKKIGS